MKAKKKPKPRPRRRKPPPVPYPVTGTRRIPIAVRLRTVKLLRDAGNICDRAGLHNIAKELREVASLWTELCRPVEPPVPYPREDWMTSGTIGQGGRKG